MMTMKAQELGMTHTRFVNANGLPDSRQVTSAHDIAMLCRAVLRDYPQYYHYFGTEEFTYRGRDHGTTTITCWATCPAWTASRPASPTPPATISPPRRCATADRLITVVLGGSSGAARNDNVEDLLLTGFDVEERRGPRRDHHR